MLTETLSDLTAAAVAGALHRTTDEFPGATTFHLVEHG
jgi:hypothetical protein